MITAVTRNWREMVLWSILKIYFAKTIDDDRDHRGRDADARRAPAFVREGHYVRAYQPLFFCFKVLFVPA